MLKAEAKPSRPRLKFWPGDGGPIFYKSKPKSKQLSTQ